MNDPRLINPVQRGVPNMGGKPLADMNRPAPPDIGLFNAGLARTESGGRYGIVNSEGYMGKYQFGRPRLNDYTRATGERFTDAQFVADPDLQERVQAWHVRDIDKALSPLVGTVVNGQAVTLNALRAMAHLGGVGGARKYVESGGKYDPADSNGTRLSDYARTHGGGAPGSPSGRPDNRNPAPVAYAYANGRMTPEDAALYEQGMAEGVFPKVETRAPDALETYAALAPKGRTLTGGAVAPRMTKQDVFATLLGGWGL